MKLDDARKPFLLFRYFFVAYPLRSTVVLLALTAAALAEGLGVAALLPLISLVIDSEGGSSTLALYVEQVFALVGLEVSLAGLLTLIVMAIVLKSLLTLLAMAQVGNSAAHVAMDLRLSFIYTLLEARWMYFVDRRSGELATAVGVEPDRASAAYVSSCRVLSGSIQLLIYLGLSVTISWVVSVIALVVGSVGIIVLNRLVTISRQGGENQTEIQKSFMMRLLQGLDGIKPLKAMARERNMAPLMEDDIKGLNHAQRMIVVTREALTESHEIIRVFAVAGGLYVFVAVWNQPVGSLLVLALLFVRTLQKVSQLQSHHQLAAINQPAFAFLQSMIAAAEKAREPSQGVQRPRLTSEISLRDVSFSYGREKVLKGASMTLPAGAFIAVVGPSGTGKTTVADLIIGLLQPQQGEIWIDDLPMTDIDSKAWRDMIGYVPQETFLFHDSVMANVTLDDEDISRAEVKTALLRAEAWAFVAALPEGMDTVVGERGARLSGGQRQRIAIARALVRDPALLILDEATTALDPETEAGIVTTIRRLSGKVTVLAISHQPAMRQAADVAYRLEKGHILTEQTREQHTIQSTDA